MKVEYIGGVTIISTESRLDSLDGPKLKDIVRELPQEPGLKVVIGMGNTLFLDSSGCGGLVSSLNTILNNNGEMKIARLTPRVIEVLRLTRLHRVLEIHDTVESAVASFN